MGRLLLPHANATVTKVTASGGQGDGWEGPTAGAARWEGEADAFVRDTRRREQNGDRTEFVDVRLVSLPEGVPVEASDTLTLTYRDEEIEVPALAVIRHQPPPGVPGGTVVEATPS